MKFCLLKQDNHEVIKAIQLLNQCANEVPAKEVHHVICTYLNDNILLVPPAIVSLNDIRKNGRTSELPIGKKILKYL